MEPENPSQQPPSSPAEHEDWEARFKGLQRTFNQLQRENGELQSALEGAWANGKALQQRIGELEATTSSVTTKYEGEMAKLQANLEAATSTNTASTQRIGELEGQIATLNRDRDIRKILAKDENRHLMPFYEANLLNLTEVEGEITEEALQPVLERANTLLGQQNAQSFQQTMAGTTPPQFSGAGTTAHSRMNVDQMRDWLSNPANMTSPDYDQVQEQYFDKLSKQ